jgi:chromosome partitioning protein
MKTITVLNYKGGVGKTTFTISVSQALSLAGYKVLAIDNDSQHNLSLLLGEEIYYPNIRDIYRSSSVGIAGKKFMSAIRQSGLPNLHMVMSHTQLCGLDIRDPYILQKIITFTGLHRYYDFVLIDNSPGIDIIQESAIHAADEIFVPTELSFFAVNGLREMHAILEDKFRDDCPITKIIPNFYRDTKQQNKYIDQISLLFPSKVTSTRLPYDSVFDLCMREGKTLFIHRLFSKAAAYYLKLIHELFDLSEDETWNRVREQRNKKLCSEARSRYYQQFRQKEQARNAKKQTPPMNCDPLQYI